MNFFLLIDHDKYKYHNIIDFCIHIFIYFKKLVEGKIYLVGSDPVFPRSDLNLGQLHPDPQPWTHMASVTVTLHFQ